MMLKNLPNGTLFVRTAWESISEDVLIFQKVKELPGGRIQVKSLAHQNKLTHMPARSQVRLVTPEDEMGAL